MVLIIRDAVAAISNRSNARPGQPEIRVYSCLFAVQAPVFLRMDCTQRREGAKKAGMQAQIALPGLQGGIMVAERFLTALFFVPFVSSW